VSQADLETNDPRPGKEYPERYSSDNNRTRGGLASSRPSGRRLVLFIPFQMVATSLHDGHFLVVSNLADDVVRRVGRRIGELRRERGLTQAELGERLGIAQKNVHRLESGTQNLTLRTIVKVAEALAVAVDDLLGAAGEGSFLHAHRAALATSSGLAPRPVPVFDVIAAAGFAREGQVADVRGWALVDEPVDERHFVVRVEGDSMTPHVAPGRWCLFRRVAVWPPRGAIVLVEVMNVDGSGRYLVKRLQRVVRADDGAVVVTLESSNPAYAPQTFTARDDGDVRVLAEFVGVVG
jgi:transcriptional regulator with XRE-family HTH domain